MCPFARSCGWCYSAVLSVLHVSSCCCDLLYVVLLPKSAKELLMSSVHSKSRWTMCLWFSIKCIPWSLPKYKFYIIHIKLNYTLNMITCDSTKFYIDVQKLLLLFSQSHIVSLVSLEVKILYASKVTWLFSLRIIIQFKDRWKTAS